MALNLIHDLDRVTPQRLPDIEQNGILSARIDERVIGLQRAFDGRDVAHTHDTAVLPSRNLYRSVTKIIAPVQAIINQDQIELVEIGHPARARSRVPRRQRGSDPGEAEAERAYPSESAS